MNEPMFVLAQTAADFTYRSDRDTVGKVEDWRVHMDEGPFEGDCEDFALTLLYRIAGDLDGMFELLRSDRAIVWWCENSKGDDHVCVELLGYGYADNVFPRWQAFEPHFTLKFPVPPNDIERALAGKPIRSPRQKLLMRIGATGLALVLGGYLFSLW